MTYTDRTIERVVVTKKNISESGQCDITLDTGWSVGCPPDVAPLLEVGSKFWVETRGLSTVSGWLVNKQWFDHRSDEDFAAEHVKFVEDSNRRRQEALDANRDIWQAEEDRLPQWLKDRLATFHEKGGEKFEREGWGYELVICRLADAYAHSNLEDDARVMSISEYEGTSGNQHDMAKALAKAHLAEPERSMAGTVSALSPITGSAFYEEES